jgi:predicted transcriptional regulator of viral defense system
MLSHCYRSGEWRACPSSSRTASPPPPCRAWSTKASSFSSALAFHELSDRIPGRIWVAIGTRDWRPQIAHPPIEIVRFGPNALETGVETHMIERVPVRIYSPAKTIVDLFRHASRQRGGVKTGITEALRAMKEALRARKASPAEIARYAHQAGVWKTMQPYLEALTLDA